MAACDVRAKPRSGFERGCSAAAKIKNVEPIYPESVQREGIQGVVVIEATVGVDGKVREAKVVQSIPQLDAAALAAVRQWEDQPARI